MKNEIQLAVTGNTSALTIREGKALELREPNVINITGDIDTVKNFVAKRYIKDVPENVDEVAVPGKVYNLQEFYKNTAVVTFNKSKLTISLEVNPQDFYGPKVSGSLMESDELAPWAINDAKTFNREELVKLIRFNKRFFADAVVHDKVLKAFESLSLTGNTQVEAASNSRGNQNTQFKKILNTDNVPTSFVLEMPLYKGQPKKKFMVDICIDSSESRVIFWFESVELKELQDSTVETIFNEQKELFGDFVIVNK